MSSYTVILRMAVENWAAAKCLLHNWLGSLIDAKEVIPSNLSTAGSNGNMLVN